MLHEFVMIANLQICMLEVFQNEFRGYVYWTHGANFGNGEFEITDALPAGSTKALSGYAQTQPSFPTWNRPSAATAHGHSSG